MRIGDIVQTPHGRGRIVSGKRYGKTYRSRTGHWVFLFYPQLLSNRVICYHRSELELVRGGDS